MRDDELTGTGQNCEEVLRAFATLLADFYNLPGGVEDALARLRAGLAGEVEPLRRLGIAHGGETVKDILLATEGFREFMTYVREEPRT